MKTLKIVATMLVCVVLFASCKNQKTEQMEAKLRAFIQKYEADVEPAQKAAAIAYWDASISGKEEDYKKAEDLNLAYTKIFTDKARFAELTEIKESGAVKDELLARELYVLYNAFAGNQVDTALLAKKIKMETAIEQKYSNFRAHVNGKELTDNQIEEILSTSKNSKELQAAWEAHKAIGSLVAADVIELVKLRNQIAKELGYNNFHEMSLQLNEQDPAEISKLFDELDEMTRPTFAQLKNEMDSCLAVRDGIKKEDLMPWHYQNRYFQEAPRIYDVDMDHYYKTADIKQLSEDYYGSIGLDIKDLVAHSDLYEKPGKNQHAYSTNIDKKGDVRVLCNIVPNANWMDTQLHEFGHASYDKNNDRELPYALRDPAHIFTTEAIAMLFGRMATNPNWMVDMKLIDTTERAKIYDPTYKVFRLQQLVFSRWAQVVYRFEKAMYENPDQDLNKLWWDLVEKYQMVKRPADRNLPDWASKIHIATVPCYYHNYLLGELLASQLNHYICANILKTDNMRLSYFGNPEVGNYLIGNIFKPCNRYNWNVMIEKATGEKLTPQYYADQFITK